jgi:hypothetical protein
MVSRASRFVIISGATNAKCLIMIFLIHFASSDPRVGFNLPSLGMSGRNIDFRETSVTYFAGENVAIFFTCIVSGK